MRAGSARRSRCVRTGSTGARAAGRGTRASSRPGARTRGSWRGATPARARSAAIRRARPTGCGGTEPDDSVDVALFVDALVAMGRESEVPLAWAQFGLGRGFGKPVARLAAARGLLAAGEWRRGLEELWRIELTEPGRDEQVALA